MGRGSTGTTEPLCAHTAAHEPWRRVEAARWAEIRAEWLRQHPTLTAAELAQRAGRHLVNPSAFLKSWVKAKRVFALAQGQRRLYPMFQFGADGQPKEAYRLLLTELGGTLDGWALAIWLTRPNAEFEGWATPLAVIAHDPDAVVRAARFERQAASF